MMFAVLVGNRVFAGFFTLLVIVLLCGSTVRASLRDTFSAMPPTVAVRQSSPGNTSGDSRSDVTGGGSGDRSFTLILLVACSLVVYFVDSRGKLSSARGRPADDVWCVRKYGSDTLHKSDRG